MHKMDKMGLYRALQIVQGDARKRELYYIAEQQKLPPSGWSKMKHIAYCQKEIDEAVATQHYCFIRMMQLSPD